MYGALLEHGMAMEDIDRMEYRLYMQIIRERAERRVRKKVDKKHAEASGGKTTVWLRRGAIDEVL